MVTATFGKVLEKQIEPTDTAYIEVDVHNDEDFSAVIPGAFFGTSVVATSGQDSDGFDLEMKLWHINDGKYVPFSSATVKPGDTMKLAASIVTEDANPGEFLIGANLSWHLDKPQRMVLKATTVTVVED